MGGAWFPYDVAYSLFAFKGEKVNVVGYQSGKLVVSGKNMEDFVRDILEPEITGEALLGYEEVHNPEWFTLHAGADESGKGDLFGPLVTACVVADGDMVRQWLELGVADSKKLTDGSILKLDKEIRKTKGVVIQTAFARMPKYNELYNKFDRNLNKLLAGITASRSTKRSISAPLRGACLTNLPSRSSLMLTLKSAKVSSSLAERKLSPILLWRRFDYCACRLRARDEAALRRVWRNLG